MSSGAEDEVCEEIDLGADEAELATFYFLNIPAIFCDVTSTQGLFRFLTILKFIDSTTQQLDEICKDRTSPLGSYHQMRCSTDRILQE